jgi:hypothetical protein
MTTVATEAVAARELAIPAHNDARTAHIPRRLDLCLRVVVGSSRGGAISSCSSAGRRSKKKRTHELLVHRRLGLGRVERGVEEESVIGPVELPWAAAGTAARSRHEATTRRARRATATGRSFIFIVVYPC